MTKYFISFGCYIQIEHDVIEVETQEEAYQYAYELAVEATNGWVGMHGFLDEEAVECGEDAEEFMCEAIENATEFWVEVYNPDEHDGYKVNESDW